MQHLAEARPINFQHVIEQGETAAQKIDLDEAATRQIVDQQLRDRGWEADSQKLTYAGGARPAKGRAMALAESELDERLEVMTVPQAHWLSDRIHCAFGHYFSSYAIVLARAHVRADRVSGRI